MNSSSEVSLERIINYSSVLILAIASIEKSQEADIYIYTSMIYT